jgi:hypothetical protein
MAGKLHVQVALSPRKDPPYALDRRLGGPQHYLDNVVTERYRLRSGIEPRNIAGHWLLS